MVEHHLGLTPLMWASNEGHEKVVEVLVSFGADVDYSHPMTGQTALSLANAKRHWGVVQRLSHRRPPDLLFNPPQVRFHYENDHQQQRNLPVTDLEGFLKSVGLVKYHPMLMSKGIDMAKFVRMNDGELKSAGVELIGPRKKMLAAIANYRLTNAIQNAL